MIATPAQQRRLLDLQTLDTTIARLSRKWKQLPERAELESLAEASATAKHDFMTVQRELDGLQAEISRLEDDVRTVASRRERDEALLAQSSSSKEAMSLQNELETLARRQTELEDRELEIMESHEAAESRMRLATEAVDAVETQRSELLAAIARAEADISAELTSAKQERAGVAAEIQGDLLELYAATRERVGIGAARLRGNVSEGSNMALTPAELSDILAAPENEVVFCPQSGAILIRDFE